MGLKFRNPVGLAAGFDKDASYVAPMSLLGFGFIEVGTVTPKPQDGNPKPRLFRLPEDQALINRMGFNNRGVDHMVQQLKGRKKDHLIIGGNLGKNKVTPNEKANDDYTYCFRSLYPYVDYFVVNVSSPNTPGLRSLQDKEPLSALLAELQSLNDSFPSRKPILLKIAPDLTRHQLDDVLDVVHSNHLDGIIATNTTISRSGLNTSAAFIEEIGAGGLSGAPVREKSTEMIRHIRNATNPDFTIIGVGGIMAAQDAVAKLEAGADLIQIYTGLIYQGPALIKGIKQAILRSKP